MVPPFTRWRGNLAEAFSMVREGWNGFNVLQKPPRALVASTLAFCRPANMA